MLNLIYNSCGICIWVRIIPVKVDQSLTGVIRTYIIIVNHVFSGKCLLAIFKKFSQEITQKMNKFLPRRGLFLDIYTGWLDSLMTTKYDFSVGDEKGKREPDSNTLSTFQSKCVINM